jgi:hypothetical protein
MKKIINNKLYDTETAKLLGTWDNNILPTDFGYIEEALYKKRSGTYFLHGKGGPMTAYAKSTGQNSWTGGEKIIPISYDMARQWAEEKLSADDYEKIFDLTEDGRVNLVVSVSPSAREKGKQKALKQGVSLSQLIETFLAN